MSGQGLNALALCFLPQPGSAHRVPEAGCQERLSLTQEEQSEQRFPSQNCREESLISLLPESELKAREEYMRGTSQPGQGPRHLPTGSCRAQGDAWVASMPT